MPKSARIALAVLALTLGVASGGSVLAAARHTHAHAHARAVAAAPSATVTDLARWAVESGDANGRPFAVVDKVAAEVFVFGPEGRLRGRAPALVGLARGDDSLPGIGDMPLSAIKPDDRTTPAGRFIARYGRDRSGREVLWVDYGDAISMHPVIQGAPKEHRFERLKSRTPKDNRITYGCINLPFQFYARIVQPSFKGDGGVVYVLPEDKPLAEVFPDFALYQSQRDQAAAASADASAPLTTGR